MRKFVLLMIFLKISLLANIFAGSATVKSMEIKGDFAKNRQCIRCHLDIYEEYKSSAHYKSTIFNDEIHKAAWEAFKKSKKPKKYICGKCHTPTLKNRSINNLKEESSAIKESIACAYCHRIEAIKKHPRENENIILNKKGVYYGTRNPKIRSEYHKIINTNIIHKNGDTCLGCHSHRKNKQGVVVCKTDSKNSMEKNCITCHMPQVEGSLSDRVETFTHAYHGFAALKNRPDLLKKYIDLVIEPKENFVKIIIKNRAPHDLILHPMRMAKLIIEVYKNNKIIKKKEIIFQKVLAKGDKPSPPWVADNILKDNVLKGEEKREFKIAIKPKNIKVVAKLGFYLIKPKLAKKMNLEKYADFRLLKKSVLNIN